MRALQGITDAFKPLHGLPTSTLVCIGLGLAWSGKGAGTEKGRGYSPVNQFKHAGSGTGVGAALELMIYARKRWGMILEN